MKSEIHDGTMQQRFADRVTLAAYFDESGTDGKSPIVAVGGYVSTVDLWDDFQREWERMLADNSINVFHTTDLLSFHREHTREKGWNEVRRDAILNRAYKIIEDHTLFGIVAFIHIEDCERFFPAKTKKTNKPGARRKFAKEYELAGGMVVIGVSRWANENNYTEPIKYVFEGGAKGKGHLFNMLEAAKRTDKYRAQYLIGRVSFENKRCVPQLHSADLLIHQSCKAIVSHVTGYATEAQTIDRLIRSKVKKTYTQDLPVMIEASKLRGGEPS